MTALFGALLRNKYGDSLLDDKEVPLLYWGKISVTVQSQNEGNPPIYLDLKKIPSSISATIFLRAKTSSGTESETNLSFAAFVDRSGPTLKLAVYNRSYIGIKPNHTNVSVSVDVYVFIPARNIRLPEWGIVVYNDDGTVAFHSGRPPINLYGISSGYLASSGWPSPTIDKNRVAGMCNVIDVRYLSNGNILNSWYGSVLFTAAVVYGSSSTAKVGVFGSRVIDETRPYIDTSLPVSGESAISVPYIDMDYYDRYLSLGDYSF